MEAPKLPEFPINDDEISTDDQGGNSVVIISSETFQEAKIQHETQRNLIAKNNPIILSSDDDDDDEEKENDDDDDQDMIDISEETEQDCVERVVDELSRIGVNKKILQNLTSYFSLVFICHFT